MWFRQRGTRLIRRLGTEESASALLETAVILPVLVLLAIGVAEYGRVYFTAITVANAAMAGAHAGAQSSGTADSTFIRQVAQADAGDATLAVTTSRSCRCPDAETTVPCSNVCTTPLGYGNPQFFVAVTATKSVSLFLRYPGLPPSILVTRTATFRVQ
jgi:Flp pilus assembly protein TadG